MFLRSVPQAGVLLEGDGDEEKDDSDCKSDVSDIFEFIPSPMSRLLYHNFDKQLQIGEVLMTVGEPATSQADEETEAGLQHTCHAVRSSRELHTGQERMEKNMQTDEKTGNHAGHKETSGQCNDLPAAPSFNAAEETSVLDMNVKNSSRKSAPEKIISEQDMNTSEPRPDKHKQEEADNTKTENQANQSSSDSDSGRPESSEEEKQGERTPSEGEISREKCGEGDSGVEEYPSMLWENLHMVVKEKEREIMSELSSGSCLMDRDIIV